MDIIIDFFVEMFFDVYSELMFLIVPEAKGNRKCEIVVVIIAIFVFVGVIALAVWGGILISDYNNRCGIIPISAAVVISLAQIIAGILEFKNGNTFGGTAFTAYGCFWWSLVAIWTPLFSEAGDALSMGFYLLLWGIFTLGMFVGALKHNTITKIVFGSLALLFFLLSLGDFTGNHTITMVAGFEGIFCGASAIYSAIGQIINGEYGKDLIRL